MIGIDFFIGVNKLSFRGLRELELPNLFAAAFNGLTMVSKTPRFVVAATYSIKEIKVVYSSSLHK